MTSLATDPNSLLPRFGLTVFRPGQRDVIDAVAAGHDVLCVMPTGGGKSLCYQLPALSREGTTIVVSPLIALMKDQVDTLQRRGIAATLINSTLSAAEQEDAMQKMAGGEFDLVYVAPERLRNSRFLDAVAGANVSLLAIDEAHCASEWGHDFRPDYSRLGDFRRKYLGGVQTIALTATATPFVRQDIQTILGMTQPKQFVTGFARENLRFSVTHSKSDREKNDTLTKFIQTQDGAGIIYAATRKRCEEIAEWLPTSLGRPVGVYHAGLDPQKRHAVQNDFMSGKLSAIIATNAFGMGIDKSDIRFVVHYNIPGSLEAYYQEAGRAGRDSKMSECRLLFAYSDRYVQEFFIENRYPSPEVIKKVYEFLLSRDEDPIELTLDQVRDALKLKETAESVGTAEALLAKAGVLKRLDNSANTAVIRIDSDLPTLVDLLPRESKIRRKVLRAAEKVVGKHRGEDVYVRPQRLADLAGVDREQLSRTLRELMKLKQFDYVPPFRGRAVHFLRRDVPFADLKIDFDELAKRKAAEYDKLESVIQFARTSRCRQLAILDYFGDPNVADCTRCDTCDPEAKCMGERPAGNSKTPKIQGVQTATSPPAKIDYDLVAFSRGIRIALSGIARMHGRFGKLMITQMLGGSNNKKIVQWRLNRLSTYGMLGGLKQSQLSDLIDALIEGGLAGQVEVEDRRPTVQLTADGEAVMRARQPIPPTLRIAYPLAKRLAFVCANIEGGDVTSEATVGDASSAENVEMVAAAPAEITTAGAMSASSSATDKNQDLIDRIKRWRSKTSAALGVPAYRVVSNATIDRIAAELPCSTTQLEMIQGIGPATIEQYGHDLMEMIAAFRADGMAADQVAADVVAVEKVVVQKVAAKKVGMEKLDGHDVAIVATPVSKAVTTAPPATAIATAIAPPATAIALPNDLHPGDAYWTWRLFRDGYTKSQICEIRRCDAETIRQDLAVAAQSGHAVDPTWSTGT